MDKRLLVNEMKKFGLDKEVIVRISEEARINSYYQILINLKSAAQIGQSKIGGVPDFPKSMQWPEPDGKPFKFIAQLNFNELPVQMDDDFPDRGILYFFLNDEDYPVEARVMYSSDNVDLEPAEIHDMLPAIDVPAANPIQLELHEDFVPPRYDWEEFNRFELTEDQKYSYEDFEYEVDMDQSLQFQYQGCYVLGSLENEWLELLALDPYENELTIGSALKGLELGRRLTYKIRINDLKKSDFTNVKASYGES